MENKNIHWFPGHMKKALNEIQAKIKIIDLVIEVLDSRAFLSTQNPYLKSIINNKPVIKLLNKIDITDKNKLEENLTDDDNVFECSITSNNFYNELIKILNKYYLKINDKFIKKGMKAQPLKILVCGIPNVGKSSLINLLARKNYDGVANIPGFTKGLKWIRVEDKFYFLDTPGILPSNYENKKYALNLAMIGSIKLDILPKTTLVEKIYSYLIKYKKEELFNYYKLDKNIEDLQGLLENLCAKRGFLLKGNKYDLEKAENLIIDDFKNGKICKIFLDNVDF